ncbi:MAG: chemotaxis protein CheX [Bacillota bacterium]|nr:chemotaxis protein CheX [Bacillota bacterium]
MSQSSMITKLLNSAIHSIKAVIPLEVEIKKPILAPKNEGSTHLGVLIGMTGECKGHLILKASPGTFGNIANSMFGMIVEGEMLFSFTGELGNMLAGNMTTYASEQGIIMDITPPTVIEGNTTFHNVKTPVELPIHVAGAGEMSFLLSIAE